MNRTPLETRLFPYYTAPGWVHDSIHSRMYAGAFGAAAVVVVLTVPGAAVVAGLSWVFVALACAWWRHRALAYHVTPFSCYSDYNEALILVRSGQGMRGLEPILPDVWSALSVASVNRDSGLFAAITLEFDRMRMSADQDPGRTESAVRTLELLKQARAELEERDSSS